MSFVILTRPLKQAHSFKRNLSRYNIKNENILVKPVVEIKWQSASLEGRYDGVIITSQNALHALKRAYSDNFHASHAYVVGEKTAHYAKKMGFTVKIAANAQNILLKEIMQAVKPPHHFYYPHGQPLTGNLKETLQKKGYRVTSKQLYQQKPILWDVAQKNEIDNLASQFKIFPVFSHFGAECLSACLKERLTLIENAHFIGMSEKALLPLKHLMHSTLTALKTPHSKAMIKAILDIYH